MDRIKKMSRSVGQLRRSSLEIKLRRDSLICPTKGDKKRKTPAKNCGRPVRAHVNSWCKRRRGRG